MKAVAHELRESWLMELAAIKAKEIGGIQHQHYKNLILQERQRISSRRMKRIFGKLKSPGLTNAVATQEDGSIREMTIKEEIERACMDVGEGSRRLLLLLSTQCPLRRFSNMFIHNVIFE